MRKVYVFLLVQCVCLSSFGQNYFRSFQSGDWNQISTWQSSSDNISWGAASSTPTSTDNIITIQSSHIVTLVAPETVDQVVIASGGVLTDLAGLLTINDGLGDDLEVQSGGVFILSFTNTPPVFSPASATARIRTGGILRVTVGGLTNAGAGVNASNFIYEDASVLEMNVLFSTDGVTYFPNVNATTIPVFRLLSSLALIGANNPTVINGVFETDFNANFINSGTKTFRNGIRGSGNVTSSPGTGKFIINGLTAQLGGSGSLIVPTAGFEIGNSTTVTMISDKTVTGNITLLTNNSLIVLGNFNLTVSGTVGITQVSSYVKTNGTGKLTLNTIGILPGKLFPIGITTINPLYILSTTTTNYSARVVEPIMPPIYNDQQAVIRTWYISTPANTPGATIAFGYSFPGSPGEVGPFYSNVGPAEIGVNIAGVWNIHQTNLIPNTNPFVSGTYAVVNTTAINYFNGTTTEFPFVVSNNGAILPLDFFITARAQKRNGGADISWKVLETDNVRDFELQRSINKGAYQTIATITPISRQLDYAYSDVSPGAGTNLYRIRANRLAGGIRYSNTVAILNGSKGLLITGLAPNPVHDNAQLTISTAKQGTVNFQLYNSYGALVRQWQSPVTNGTNTIPLNMAAIAAGVYQLSASADGEKTIFRVVKE